MFAVHDKIAGAIAAKLKTTLAGTPASRAQRATDNIEAYEAYLRDARCSMISTGPISVASGKLTSPVVALQAA